jgi:hypothetical protein
MLPIYIYIYIYISELYVLLAIKEFLINIVVFFMDSQLAKLALK